MHAVLKKATRKKGKHIHDERKRKLKENLEVLRKSKNAWKLLLEKLTILLMNYID